MREVLSELCLSTFAQLAMVISTDGRVVAAGGKTKDFELPTIAALAVGNLTTSRKLAHMLDEPEFSLLIQHDKRNNLFMAAIESHAVLMVVFDEATAFGALKARVRRAITQLQSLVSPCLETGQAEGGAASEESQLRPPLPDRE